ncbi:hypothetical protein DNTS_012129 [Danionella cerebrum]|uniref:Uncharacterized protein n=1 Tax=Danionella cerebrum TaxID=2873325 RepID=A0A553PUF7_9TELE|nr:hypothetical protein DNTS_012129 [Danionella translucida]
MGKFFNQSPLSLWSFGLNPLPFDPASNNEPLQFSSTNGPLVSDCPVENGTENSKKRKRPSLPPGDQPPSIRLAGVDGTGLQMHCRK